MLSYDKTEGSSCFTNNISQSVEYQDLKQSNFINTNTVYSTKVAVSSIFLSAIKENLAY